MNRKTIIMLAILAPLSLMGCKEVLDKFGLHTNMKHRELGMHSHGFGESIYWHHHPSEPMTEKQELTSE